MNQLYREHILDHYRHPRHHGRLANPTAKIDEANPLCGDTLHLEVVVRDGVLTDVAFEGQGCAISQAGASILSEAVTGRKVSEVPSDREMLELLGVPLSPVRLKCGLLALAALRKAV